MTASEFAAYLDRLLHTADVPDYPSAMNGLQVDRAGELKRIAFAVDAVQATIDEAIRNGADLLVVHHGLFWGGTEPIVGRHYRRLKTVFGANLGLYSSHLPLDVHPEYGNNSVLARELGIQVAGTFGEFKGMPLGVWGTLEIRREALAARLDQILGTRIRLIAGGPERIGRVGIITGAAGSQTSASIREGLDAFITGEANHHTYFDASEGGINLYLAGHYATETWGLKALMTHVGHELSLDCIFIDHPTGL